MLENIEENQLYLDVMARGDKRWKMYELGFESTSFYLSIRISSSAGHDSQNVALQERVHELEKQIKDERRRVNQLEM